MATVSVTVTCVDDVPVAVDDTATVVEDSSATAVNVLANDSNPDGETLSISAVTQPANGTVVITGGGTGLTYGPNPDYCNTKPSQSGIPDTFTYTLSPGNDVGTVSMTVTCVNDAPLASDDALSAVLEDSGQRTIAFATLLANDTAGPGEATQTLTITLVSNPVGGSVSISGTDVLFTPAADFNGQASFTYTVTDDGTTNGAPDPLTDTGAVTFTVTPVNDAPSFTVGANQSVLENSGAQTVVGWATGISPGPNEAGQTVAFVITNNTLPGLFSVAPAVSSTGTLAYTPAVGASGIATITLKLTDDGGTTDGGVNESPTQQFTITVVPVPDPPVASPDSYQFIGNTTLEVDSVQDAAPSVFVNSAAGVLANDSDPDSSIAVTGISAPACASVAPFDCATANGGRVLMQTNGQFRYTPKEGDTAASDTFTYTVSDGSTTVSAVVTLNRSDRVWYVRNNATAGGLGRSSDPFDTLVEAQTASLANDYIFVYFGDGTSTGQAAGFTIKNGQHLIGEFSGLSIPVGLNGNASPTVLVAQPDAIACGGIPCRPMLDDTAAGAPQGVDAFDVVPAEIRGLDLASTTGNAINWETQAAFAGTGAVTIADNVVRDATSFGIRANLAGSGATTLAFQNNQIRSAGTATSIVRTGTGVLTITAFNDNTVSGDSGGGVVVIGAAFDQTPGGGFQPVNGGTLAIGDAGNPVNLNALVLTAVTGDLLFSNLDAHASGGLPGEAIRVQGTGVFSAAAGTGMQLVATNPVNASAANGSVLDLQNVTVNLPFTSLTANGGTGPGVSLNTVAGSIAVTGATSLGATTPMGLQGILISGSSAAVSFGTSTTIRATTQGILVGTTTGNVSFGNTTITRATDAISLQNNSGGTRSFGTITVTSTANSVTGAGLVHAVGGGSVSIGGVTIITDVGGRGIDIQNSTSGITFGNTTVTATGGTGVHLVNNTAPIAFADLDIAPDSGQVPFNATGNTAAISATSGTIAATAAAVLVVDGPAGLTPLNLALTNVSTTACSGSAISLIDASGTVTMAGGTIPSCDAASFLVSGGTVSASYSGSITQANAFPMVSIDGAHATGTITFQTGTLSATNGSGLQFDNADGVYNFNGTTTLTGGDAGIDILNGSAGTFTFGTGTAITNPSGVGFSVASSNANVTYSGSITDNTGLAVSIDNHDAGTITFQTGTITSTGAGLSVANSNGGSVNFNNPSIQLSTGASAAVTLSSNTSGTVNFATGAGAGLDITTTSGVGFNATGGGTISVTGSGNTISSGTGTALNVANTTIGASGLTFVSISANGGANGIVLNTTGALGGLTVTGSGGVCTSATPTCTGGRIQNTVGADSSSATPIGTGIVLNSTRNVSLSLMRIDNHSNFGVRGTDVQGFTMANTVIDGINGNNDGFDEGAVSFTNLTGSASVTNSSIGGAIEHNMQVLNSSGSLNRLTVSGTTFGPMDTTFGSDGLLIESSGTAVMNVTVDSNIFTSARGDHFQYSNTTAAQTGDVVFTNNTITNAHPAVVGGGGGIRIVGGNNTGQNGSITFNVSGNTMRGARGTALAVNKLGGTGTYSGTIANNVVGAAGVQGSGSLEGSGIFVLTDGGGTYTASITGNTVRQYDNDGIFVQTGGSGAIGNGAMNVTVTGNTVTEPETQVAGALATNGFHLNGGTTPGDTYQVCVSLSGNALAGSGQDTIPAGSAFGDFRLRQRQTTTVRLPGYAGSATDTAAVVTFLQGLNPGGEIGVASVNSPPGGGFVGGAACALPARPAGQ